MLISIFFAFSWSFHSGSVVKNPSANAGDKGDTGSIPGWGRSPGGEHGNPLQYSCLENPMDTGVWWAIIHSITELDMTEDIHLLHYFALDANIWWRLIHSKSSCICWIENSIHISVLTLSENCGKKRRNQTDTVPSEIQAEPHTTQ